tara:strand:- start:60 stop:749 length:690 start_codon:yes stop_codon:yes gene_type:complete
MKRIIVIYKIQIVIACFLLASCSQLGSFLPKTIDVPFDKNVVKFTNGAVGLPPEGYCSGPSKSKSYTGNVIYTPCQITEGRGMVSISFAPMGTDDVGKITRSYLANDQKIIQTDYFNGYDLVKVENSQFSVDSVQDTVWRVAKVEKGYVVLAQYFSPNMKNVSDLHQLEVLTASVDNFSPPQIVPSDKLSDLDLTSGDQTTIKSAKPKMRPKTTIHKFSASKIRPKLRP